MQARRSFLMRLPVFSAAASSPSATPSKTLHQRLIDALGSIETIDTHEHIIPEAQRVTQAVDFFTLSSHYSINDLVSAGLPPDSPRLLNDNRVEPAERWRLFEPFWNVAKFTGYGQALRIAVREIYGFEEISSATLPRINDAIRLRNKLGLYRDVLRKRARIRFSVVDDYWNAVPVRPDPEFFVLAHKFDRFVQPWTPQDIAALEKITDVAITTLAGLKEALEKNFQQSMDAGMVTVKTTLAYERDLHFREVTESDAARDLARLLQGNQALPEGFRRHVVRPYRDLEDHMFHHLIRLTDAHRLPFQIHTGLHAGNGNFIANSNPTLLTNLFFLYPGVQFDLFHISYPYQGELSVLAKLFPNVYIDFCWAHIVSPSAAKRALHEMLETVPANKIFAFGGDYRFPELSYAHLVMARQNVAQVLAEKVESRFCTEEEATTLGRMLFHDNPSALFAPIRTRSMAPA